MTAHPSARRTRQSFTFLLLAILLLLGAAYLRAYRFGDWPPGLSHDEGINAIDGYSWGHGGAVPLYMRTGEVEPLYRVFLALSIRLIGPTRFGALIVSLYFGVLGVAAALRAGRHLVPLTPDSWSRPARRLAALAAGGVLAIMVIHIVFSRVLYRGIMLPFALLMFFDAFVVAWTHRRRRDFLAAGLFLAWVLMSYMSALAALPVAAIGVLHQAIVHLKPGTRRAGEVRSWWQGIFWFGLAFLICVSPLIVMGIVQPDLYNRIPEVASQRTGSLLLHYLDRIVRTWEGVWSVGDINPQYNAAQTPLLHVRALYWLLWVGVAACVLRWRRLASWLALSMLFFMLLPVALSIEIPHGLRMSGEFAPVALVVAASVDPIFWAIRRLAASGRVIRVSPRLAAFGVGLPLLALIVFGGVRAWQIYTTYYQSDVRWGVGGPVSAWTWFFETRRETVAQAIADAEGVVYVPQTEAYHPSFRYFTLNTHPQIATFATYFGGGEPLDLPAGQFVIPPGLEHAATFAAFMPDGTLVMLPRFEDSTLEALNAALAASDMTLVDPYGELAAIVVNFPAAGSPLRIEQPVQHAVSINYDDQFTLVGWAGPESLPSEGGEIDVTLYLAPGPQIRREVTIFAQLWTVDLQNIGASGEPMLLRWVYLPARWQSGDVAPFVLSVPVPEGLSPGAYYLAVGLRDWRQRHLPVLGADGAPVADTAIAGTLKIPRTERISLDENIVEASAEFGGEVELIGYQIAGPDGAPLDTLSPGQPAVVTLVWRALRRPADNYTVFVHVTDPAGSIVAQNDTQPEGGRYPTGVWDAGEIVATTHPITFPAGSSGPYTLYVGWYSFPSLERLPATQGGEEIEDRRAVIELGE